jgi:hypothetical protein
MNTERGNVHRVDLFATQPVDTGVATDTPDMELPIDTSITPFTVEVNWEERRRKGNSNAGMGPDLPFHFPDMSRRIIVEDKTAM